VTALVLPVPPNPFPPINDVILTAGTPLHRTHSRSLRPAQFNPGFGAPTRFAPFEAVPGVTVPTLYGGTTREAAVYESIFHDIESSAPFKTVSLHKVTERSVSCIAPLRDLRLASLFAPDLKRWSLARTDLIETPKSTYSQTVAWAQAIHRADRMIEGLMWTSRQCDPERCVVLFGDRVAETDFDVVERLEVNANAALLLDIRTYGARGGIVLVS
jgi:hypothetical protein